MSVSYTSNLLEQMCDFQVRTMFNLTWISNLQDLLQSQNLDIVLMDSVAQYFPHHNTVCSHLGNDCKRSNALNICHWLCSTL